MKSNNHFAQKEVQFSRGYEILKVHVNLLLMYFEKDSLQFHWTVKDTWGLRALLHFKQNSKFNLVFSSVVPPHCTRLLLGAKEILIKMRLTSRVSDCLETSAQSLTHIWLFAALWTIACGSLSMGFSRQEYWSRLPCPPPLETSTRDLLPVESSRKPLASTSTKGYIKNVTPERTDTRLLKIFRLQRLSSKGWINLKNFLNFKTWHLKIKRDIRWFRRRGI